MISQSYGFRKAARSQKESQQHVLVEKISPLFDVYPHYKIHWGFDGMPMRPKMKFADDMFLWLFICGMSGKAREVLDVYVATRVFIKCLCLSPLRIFHLFCRRVILQDTVSGFKGLGTKVEVSVASNIEGKHWWFISRRLACLKRKETKKVPYEKKQIWINN